MKNAIGGVGERPATLSLRAKNRGGKLKQSRGMPGRLGAVASIVGVLSLVSVVCMASSSYATGASAPSPLQRGLAFYKGKSITYIAPGTPGATFDVYIRALAPYIAAYLHASVNIIDNGAAGGISAQDQLAASSPDGLTIGTLNMGLDAADVLTQVPGLNFNPSHEGFIAGANAGVQVLIASSTSPFTTFLSFKDAATPTKVLAFFAGSSLVAMPAFYSLLGMNVQYVTGYPTSASVISGFTRGDGPITMFSLNTAGPLLQSGVARALAVWYLPKAGTNYRQFVTNVPTFAKIEATYFPKTTAAQSDIPILNDILEMGNSVVTQSAVPAFKLDALRAAVKWAYSKPGFIQALLKVGQPSSYIDPVAAKANYIAAVVKGSRLACFANGKVATIPRCTA